MLNWRKDKNGDSGKAGAGQKATSSGSKSEASRSASGSSAPDNAAASTGPDNRRMLGEMLVSEGIISQKQLNEALARKDKSGGFLGQILVELEYVKQNDLISFLVKQCKIPHISLADYQISQELLSLVPEEVCLEHGLLPIDKLGSILTVAMVDPLDAAALEAVRTACPDLRIKPILCDWNHFAPACDRLFNTGKEGGAALTASSFGLSERKSEVAEETPESPDPSEESDDPDRAEAPVSKPPASQEAPEGKTEDIDAAVETLLQSQPKPKGPSGLSEPSTVVSGVKAEDIAAGLRDSMREALHEVVASLAKTQSPAAPAPDYAELAKLMRESVEQGMAKSTGSLVDAMQAAAAATQRGEEKDSVSAAQMAEILRENLGETMEKSLGKLAQSLQGAGTHGEAPAGPSADDLARAVNQSMQDSLGVIAQQFSAALETESKRNDDTQKALGAMAQQFSAALENESKRNDDTQKALGAMTQQFSAALESESKRTEDTQKALLALHEALAGGKDSSQTHTAQIIEIAEAAKRAAETAEKAIEALQEAKMPAAAEAAGQDNVHEFPGGIARTSDEAEVPALDALDGPGLAAGTSEQIRAALENEQPIPGFTFEGFIGGKTNELTVTLCKALAAGHTGQLTPFYLYGSVGLGKSHLLNAIGNNLIARNPDTRIGYVSAGMLARGFAKALGEDQAVEFRARYCDMDMLLVDDVHLLAQKTAAQEEMLYLLDAFLHEGRPLLLAGNASPDKLNGLDSCLASRLFSGVVSSVRAPEQAARAEILARQARSAQADVPEEIRQLIATQIQDDMRKMTGALRKVIAYAHVSGQAIDKTLAGEVLSQLGVNAA